MVLSYQRVFFLKKIRGWGFRDTRLGRSIYCCGRRPNQLPARCSRSSSDNFSSQAGLMIPVILEPILLLSIGKAEHLPYFS
jgi:hypothetical protein